MYDGGDVGNLAVAMCRDVCLKQQDLCPFAQEPGFLNESFAVTVTGVVKGAAGSAVTLAAAVVVPWVAGLGSGVALSASQTAGIAWAASTAACAASGPAAATAAATSAASAAAVQAGVGAAAAAEIGTAVGANAAFGTAVAASGGAVTSAVTGAGELAVGGAASTAGGMGTVAAVGVVAGAAIGIGALLTPVWLGLCRVKSQIVVRTGNVVLEDGQVSTFSGKVSGFPKHIRMGKEQSFDVDNCWGSACGACFVARWRIQGTRKYFYVCGVNSFNRCHDDLICASGVSAQPQSLQVLYDRFCDHSVNKSEFQSISFNTEKTHTWLAMPCEDYWIAALMTSFRDGFAVFAVEKKKV